MDDIKAIVARGGYQIMFNTSSKAKSDVWEDSGALKEYENNTVSVFAACKKSPRVLAFDCHKLGSLSRWKHVDSCRSTDTTPVENTSE